jgi:hypothetical protein
MRPDERWGSAQLPRSRPARSLAEYAGTYNHPAFGDILVRSEEDQLVIAWSVFESPLVDGDREVFTASSLDRTNAWTPSGWHARVRFSPDLSGRIAALDVGFIMGLENILFTKRPPLAHPGPAPAARAEARDERSQDTRPAARQPLPASPARGR